MRFGHEIVKRGFFSSVESRDGERWPGRSPWIGRVVYMWTSKLMNLILISWPLIPFVSLEGGFPCLALAKARWVQRATDVGGLCLPETNGVRHGLDWVHAG